MNNRQTTISKYNKLYLLGLIFILTGLIVFLDNLLKTGWLVYIIMPVIGLILLFSTIRRYSLGYSLAGCLLVGSGWLLFFLFNSVFPMTWVERVGFGLLGFGLGWLVYYIIAFRYYQRSPFWVFIPSGLLISTGICLSLTSIRFVDFVLFTLIGLGIPLLIWGISQKLLGLIIPGSLLCTIGPGIYVPWSSQGEPSSLSKTGMMLVVFALGWVLIILFSRMITDKFMWWPLIPGGIMAVVGWGLYIGGNPENAISFIGNTGSLGLMIFGFYLLLLRRGFRQ